MLVELTRFYIILADKSNVNIVLSGAEEEWHQQVNKEYTES